MPMNLSVVIEATNAVDGIIYDTHARFKVDVTNNADGEFNRYLLAPLFIVEDGSGTMVTYQQTTLRIPAHETVTLYYDFDNLAYGSTYALNIYGRNENEQTVNLVEPGHSVYYQVQRGLVTWDGTSMVGNSGPASGNITIPSNALAARLEGLNITSVTPSGNPNTIYFIGENEAVPAFTAILNGQIHVGLSDEEPSRTAMATSSHRASLLRASAMSAPSLRPARTVLPRTGAPSCCHSLLPLARQATACGLSASLRKRTVW